MQNLENNQVEQNEQNADNTQNKKEKRPEAYTYRCHSAPTDAKARLARCFGQAVSKQPVRILIDFLKSSPVSNKATTMWWNQDLEARFFVDCMYCYFHRRDDEYVPYAMRFETALGILYREGSDSMRMQIENLISLDIKESGSFVRRLATIVKMNSKLFADIDYDRLLQDLRYWNHEEKRSRIRWACEITRYPENSIVGNQNEIETEEQAS